MIKEQHIITPEQCRAARHGLGWSVRRLSQEAGVGPAAVSRFEMRHTGKIQERTISKIVRALSENGAIFEAAGVRFSHGATVPVRVRPMALVRT
jgi:hypothetical protein